MDIPYNAIHWATGSHVNSRVAAEFECILQGKGWCQRSPPHTGILSSDSVVVRMDTEEIVYRYHQLTAATFINVQARTTIFGAIISRDSGGKESDYSEGDDSIVHWRDNVVVVFVVLVVTFKFRVVDILCKMLRLSVKKKKKGTSSRYSHASFTVLLAMTTRLHQRNCHNSFWLVLLLYMALAL